MADSPPPQPGRAGDDPTFESVLASCLRRIDDDGPAAVEAVCAEHPGHAARLRAKLARLGRAGLLAAEETAGDTRPGPAAARPRWLGLPEIGDDFGPYRILESLGQGGMGIVFLAEHRELGRRVALKLIRPEHAIGDGAEQRFWREAKAASRLDHAGICPLYEVGQVDGVPYLTMRYLEGETLECWIERGRARSDGIRVAVPAAAAGRGAVERLAALFEKLARALQHAHDRGVVHRDIKPGNVIVTADGEPWILDFGLARPLDAADDSLTATGQLLGTPVYMSPEQIAARGPVGPASDVYSLGVALYACLSCELPFGGRSLHELQRAILHDPAPPLRRANPAVPRDLSAAVGKALEKSPARRYRSAAELADDLARWLRAEPVLARPAGPLLRGARWVRRNPWASGLLAVAGAATTVITLLSLDALERQDVLRLVASEDQVRRARAEEPGLYPAWPRNLAAIRDWLARYDESPDRIAVRLGELRDRRDRLRRRAAAGAGGELVFADPADRKLDEDLGRVIDTLAAFAEDAKGTVQRLRRLARHAEQVGERTLVAAAGAWREAARAIARGPRYAGCPGLADLAPQVGLVPLGADPETGLWEFLHVGSGAGPVRSASTGRYELTGETGIVFVLLPGGDVSIGAQAADVNAPGYDEMAREHEGPPHRVRLDPFFLAKHELTQGQWLRLADLGNPSEFAAGGTDSVTGRRATLAHPVESIQPALAREVLWWFGLELPTEVQWEYGCRAGAATRWWCGADVGSLDGVANLADATGGSAQYAVQPGLDDGHYRAAPVDALLPNGFGLHHVHGNLAELCADGWTEGYSDAPAQDGSGLRRRAEAGDYFVVRGGSWYDLAYAARCTHRRVGSESNVIGVRPARAIR